MRAKKLDVEWTGQVVIAGAGRKKAKAEPESSVLRRVTEALWAVGGVEVMRNNVGAIKKGARFIRYGLAVGSSDLVCIVAPHGRWLCVEVKDSAGGEVSEAQTKWLEKMRLYGAVTGIATCPEDALALVLEARKAA